ncbi:MAG TPA: hypothetical protein VNS34_19055 [Rhizobiaceae bacterium]|nr:hypothetical protein [Rhizobiaceae bacterium]
MSTQISFRTAMVLAVLTATGAAAETYKKYGAEAGWDVYVTEGEDRGCLMSRNLTDETQFQMGIVPEAQARGYLALYAKTGAQVFEGEQISVLFDVDGQQFTGEATGRQMMDGYKGAFVWVDNPEFIYDLAKKKTLTVTPAGREPIVLSLAGTDAALKLLRDCQEAQ